MSDCLCQASCPGICFSKIVFDLYLTHLLYIVMLKESTSLSQKHMTDSNKTKPRWKDCDIHYLLFIQGGSHRQQLKQEDPDPWLLSPQALGSASPGESQGIPRLAKKYSPFSISLVFLWVSSQLDMLRAPHQGGVLTRCPNHLNQLNLMWRNSRSTLSPSQMSRFWRESPDTRQRKLISSSCSFGHYPKLLPWP